MDDGRGRPRNGTGNWVAALLAAVTQLVGLLFWLFATYPWSDRMRDGPGREIVLNLLALCAVVGAVGFGHGVAAVGGRHRPRWAAWASLLLNGGLVVVAVVRTARWL
jgi:hypothetical protein